LSKSNRGIDSAGRIAAWFCQDLAFTQNGDLYGVAARQQANANTLVKQYDGQKSEILLS
jgi:hypothetical protein